MELADTGAEDKFDLTTKNAKGHEKGTTIEKAGPLRKNNRRGWPEG